MPWRENSCVSSLIVGNKLASLPTVAFRLVVQLISVKAKSRSFESSMGEIEKLVFSAL